MTKTASAGLPELERSPLKERDSEGFHDEDHSFVEEEDRFIRRGKYISGGFLLLLLPVIGGLLYQYLQVDTPQASILPSTIEALDDTSNQVGDIIAEEAQKEVIFHQNFNLQSGKEGWGESESSGASSSALAESRQSLSNFDLGAYTFLNENQWIHQDTRIRIRPGKDDFFLQQQSDGNLVLYDGNLFVYWNSGVVHSPSAKKYSTIMQGDGNLVTISRINNGSPNVEWASNSNGSDGPYSIALTPDEKGVMIVRRDSRQVLWSTRSVSDSQPNPSTSSTNGQITFTPGKLNRRENGLLLSEGLRSRLVAKTGKKVQLDGRDGDQSGQKFHVRPDGAAVFADPETGGWIYVSNSEAKEEDYGLNRGGVGAIYFDKDARTTHYRMLQTGTTANCSGGKTPWNTWVTCEERDGGRVYQVDPSGRRGTQEMNIDRGAFEAFAYDIRDRNHPRFFITEDAPRGALRRFSPAVQNWNDPWQLLHAPGTLQYLVLEPKGSKGTFRWTTDREYAKRNAEMYYPFSEGIDVYRNQLFFTIKERKELFVLDLDRKTYERQSTRSGAFDGMPDQVKRIVDDGLLYFCEEAGVQNGIHARDQNGWFFTILETDTFNDESTGLAFSPNGKRMYVAFQKTGQIFDIWREDGLPFHGQTLNIRYH